MNRKLNLGLKVSRKLHPHEHPRSKERDNDEDEAEGCQQEFVEFWLSVASEIKDYEAQTTDGEEEG